MSESNNDVWLKGKFEITAVDTINLDGASVPLIRGCVYTDKAPNGGRHPVLIQGEVVEFTLKAARRWERLRGNRLPEVSVDGELKSMPGEHFVMVRHIKFVDLPAHDDLIEDGVEGPLVNTAPMTAIGRFEVVGQELKVGSRIDMRIAGQWIPGHVDLVDERFVFVPHGESFIIPLMYGMTARRPSRQKVPQA
jgi:hypothetical protein